MTSSEKEDERITLEDLEKFILSPGHLFFKLKSGKDIELKKPGALIQKSFIDRYAQKGVQVFVLKRTLQEDKVQLLVNELKEFGADEAEAVLKREELIESFKKVLKGCNFLTLAVLGLEAFALFTEDQREELYQLDAKLFERSCLLASLASLFAILSGYLDRQYIRDFYHTAFLMDYGLCLPKFNFKYWKALQDEDLSDLNASEGMAFAGYPERSLELIAKSFSQCFSNVENSKMIGRKGFPRDGEKLLSCLSQMIPYEIDFNHKFNLEEFASDIESKISSRIYRIINQEIGA